MVIIIAKDRTWQSRGGLLYSSALLQMPLELQMVGLRQERSPARPGLGAEALVSAGRKSIVDAGHGFSSDNLVVTCSFQDFEETPGGWAGA